jgi:cysteine-rich CWC protein
MRDDVPTSTGEIASTSSCPRCGARFTCGMLAGLSACWCAALPPATAIPDAAVGCYCPDCLKVLVGAAAHAGST